MSARRSPSPVMGMPVLCALGLLLCVSRTWCPVAAEPRSHCDDGKLLLHRDLIAPADLRCPGPGWTEPRQRLPIVDRKFVPQPPSTICMDSAISYNHTIPHSGPHRPVAAQSGEYLYCPPQRWLRNLQLGAVVLLYHPCTSLSQHALLSVLARSCLLHYIITPFPQLSRKRPFALVTWGRTLELSHVTASDVCYWLSLNVRDSVQRDLHKRAVYSLLLRRASESQQIRTTSQEDMQQEAVRYCCEKSLSLLLEGGGRTVVQGWKKKRRTEVLFSSLVIEGMNVELRRKRAADPDSELGRESTTQLEASKGQLIPSPEQETNLRHEETPGSAVTGTVEAVGGQEEGVQNGTHDTTEKIRTPESKEIEEGAEGKSEPGNLGVPTAEGSRRKGLKSKEVQLKEVQSDGTRVEQHIHMETPQMKQQQMESEFHQADCGGTKEQERAGGTVSVQRMPTARTDEAVWAAGALSFLLALLALSVLHTRLYRNWRSPPSVYWRDPSMDYESVADVIRRRLKMMGRRKRRSIPSRRQERTLLHTSSSEESN
ncbi:tumor protein p53-inducible protein 13 [Arapaima gigas]